MIEKNKILDEIINAWIKNINDLDKESFHKLKNKIFKKYSIEKPFASIEIIDRYNNLIQEWKMKEDLKFKKILRKRWVRSLSWVTVISLLTKPFPCPGKCIYCPDFEKLPKSYIPNEPAVMRAELNKFDPIKQVHNRLRALEVTWHKIEKNDVRIIWGSWTTYPEKYKKKFIKWIYDAFNSYEDMKNHIEETDLSSNRFASFTIKDWYEIKKSKSLKQAKKLNEISKCRVIGIAIETRPDLVSLEEIKKLREYWVTRVEIWYQTTIDEINKLNKRGHTNKESIKTTRLLKDAWFKVVAHMMPNLLWSTPELDKESMENVFLDPDFRPDELKIYPMVVTKNSKLTKIWEKWWFEAYDDETLIDLIADLEAMLPEYIRLNRTYRDIPASEILAWSKISNLRQIVEKRLKEKWRKIIDIRSREIKSKNNDPKNAVLKTIKYKASKWVEYFLTFEDKKDKTIFSLLRLRLPSKWPSNIPIDWKKVPLKDKFSSVQDVLPELNGCAIIREVHTFGDQLSIWEKWAKFGQHLGFGKKLIKKAEEIAIEFWYKKMAVIAWVWVRRYYEKSGYMLVWEYMVKELL